MAELDLEKLFDKAAVRHGHKCPSLYYGVRGAVTALKLAVESNITVKQAVIQGTSKCIRDGAGTVFATQAQLTPVLLEDGCGISLGDGAQNIQLMLNSHVREKVNSLNKQLPMAEFQQQGLKYLQGLSDEDLFKTITLTEKQFNRLLNAGE